jgi:hypothetical protein
MRSARLGFAGRIPLQALVLASMFIRRLIAYGRIMRSANFQPTSLRPDLH